MVVNDSVAEAGMFSVSSLKPWLCFLVLSGEAEPLGRGQLLGLLSKMVPSAAAVTDLE